MSSMRIPLRLLTGYTYSIYTFFIVSCHQLEYFAANTHLDCYRCCWDGCCDWGCLLTACLDGWESSEGMCEEWRTSSRRPLSPLQQRSPKSHFLPETEIPLSRSYFYSKVMVTEFRTIFAWLETNRWTRQCSFTSQVWSGTNSLQPVGWKAG